MKRFAISLCASALTMCVMGCSQPDVQAPPPAAEQPPAAPPVDRQAEFGKFPEREFLRLNLDKFEWRATEGNKLGVQTAILDVATGLRTLGDASFDVAFASNVLEHFPPETTASIAGDIAAILKPGGRLIVIQPNFKYAWRTYFDDYTHRSVFTDVSLPALLRSTGLAIEHVEPKFMPYSMQGTRFRPRPWLVRAYLHSPIRPRAGQMLVVARKG